MGMNRVNAISIKSKVLSQYERPFILAEMACAHDGSVDRANKMVDAAVAAGVDGIQFQLFSTDSLLIPTHPLYDKVKSIEIPLEYWPKIIKRAKDKGLIVFVNVLEASCLATALSSDIDALKIHSADISNPHMLQGVAKSGLPVSLSTGGSTVEEINIAFNELRTLGVKDIILMHGYQGYPTLIEESHLNYIETLGQLYDVPVGYQDHVDGDDKLAKIVPLLAMAKGAVLLEKHITDDRGRKGTDYESALDADGMKDFVELVQTSWMTLGKSTVRQLSSEEHKYRKTFKKAIVAISEIQKDEVITDNMIAFMRGEQGFTPLETEKVIGKKSSCLIQKYQTIKPEYIHN